ncbi:hypothetical protein A3B21_04800 [Candidatus Uhrbacteria bacterium RIFCSPLOWO2_01_FULL_47_24]|uniref:Uncharacterized protein n=1 Tax=Candidatus Uhrbacteria bacterium RIFCSPLOWO2_01_FULL_47_24 TaxID=1802401 RepID=A0A1F7UWC6_9BACT|nr:MAG: hypothetical protein A2753_00420 [Candidatus Uhrbacteria bacterium RIFCSPHIGHO2_01_FULL_47_11]OGL69272.1 MAG: hypothetical protein A3D58_03185 [Candidatus Uhrbacteria bacterium RIFCSPHIGHO2_02_FULL_46_47]OGL82008.1 MAG: hypothetical protein A3B21_04800 [Candidatus Uhrbacteria bacterium RIFCSPLOWO2_01_FULL_47_24]OGL85402.1 MAG: hypothetical protein A3J03_04965 [Candidatus Uhrbacteria bacterium RIFCSPLOWO2_02_FULL_46_25]OGL92281.1 MAG: hypothetical protein A3H11_02040 [Candidatus Uhrbacte
MSLTRAVARNTFVQLIGRVISIALALIVVAIMTRALGPDGFGGYSIIIAFLQFFGITVDFGLTLTANRMLSEIHNSPQPPLTLRGGDNSNPPLKIRGGAGGVMNDASRLMSNLMTLRFVSAIVFLGLAPLVALFFPYPPEVKQGILLTSFSFLAVIMGQTLTPIFQKELRMGYVVVAELIGRVVLLAGVTLAAYFSAGLLWFMAAVVAGSIAQYIATRKAASKFIKLRFAFDREIWKKIIRTSWPIGVSIIFNLIYLKADTIILSVLRPQAEVGFYGAAYRVIDQFTAVATMFIGLVLPPLTAAWVAGNRERFTRIYQGAFDAYTIIAFPLMVGALMLGTKLMAFVAGANFAASGTVLGILMLGMVAIFFSTLFGHVIVVLNKQKPMILGYAATAVLGLTAYALVIPHYGMFGAAWTTVGTEFLIMLITFMVVSRVTKLKPNNFVLWRSILASAIMGYTLYIFSTYHFLVLLFGGTLIYGIALFALGGIKKEMIREILSIRSLP